MVEITAEQCQLRNEEPLLWLMSRQGEIPTVKLRASLVVDVTAGGNTNCETEGLSCG